MSMQGCGVSPRSAPHYQRHPALFYGHKYFLAQEWRSSLRAQTVYTLFYVHINHSLYVGFFVDVTSPAWFRTVYYLWTKVSLVPFRVGAMNNRTQTHRRNASQPYAWTFRCP